MHIYKMGRMNDGLSTHTPRFPCILCSYTWRSTVLQLLCPLPAGKLLLFSSVRSLPLRQGITHRERRPLTACKHGGGERCPSLLFPPRSFCCGSSTMGCNNHLQTRLIASLVEVKPVYTALHYRALEIPPFSFSFSSL